VPAPARLRIKTLKDKTLKESSFKARGIAGSANRFKRKAGSVTNPAPESLCSLRTTHMVRETVTAC